MASDGQAYVWDLRTGQQVRVIEGPNLKAIALTPDGHSLVAVNNKDVMVWDLASGKVLHRFEISRSSLSFNRLAVTPDGRHVVVTGTSSADGIWELPTGRLVSRFSDRESRYGLALVANGTEGICTTTKKKLVRWQMPGGQFSAPSRCLAMP